MPKPPLLCLSPLLSGKESNLSREDWCTAFTHTVLPLTHSLSCVWRRDRLHLVGTCIFLEAWHSTSLETASVAGDRTAKVLTYYCCHYSLKINKHAMDWLRIPHYLKKCSIYNFSQDRSLFVTQLFLFKTGQSNLLISEVSATEIDTLMVMIPTR